MNLLGIYLSASVLLIVILALNVSRLRIKEQVGNGDGGNKKLTKAIRAHMNALEHILPFSLLLYFAQSQGITVLWFSVLGFGFLFVRILHGYSMLFSRFRLRQMSAAMTYILELALCIWVLVNALS